MNRVFDCGPLLHITPLVPMFGRDIHTMLRGLRLDRYVFPRSGIRSSQGRRFPLRVTRPTEIASHSVGAHGAGAFVQRRTNGQSSRLCGMRLCTSRTVSASGKRNSGMGRESDPGRKVMCCALLCRPRSRNAERRTSKQIEVLVPEHVDDLQPLFCS